MVQRRTVIAAVTPLLFGLTAASLVWFPIVSQAGVEFKSAANTQGLWVPWSAVVYFTVLALLAVVFYLSRKPHDQVSADAETVTNVETPVSTPI
ncbi:MAG TPA: hypothetical protein VFO38_04050 [Candidatus Saccharimonadales bacterium]|nr:hypothetical protein [Candidatus Saccharimonadales bacterium]